MDNILVTLSNFAAIPVIGRAYFQGRYAETYLLSGSMISSILYHLAEHSKHHMSGFKLLAPYDQTLLNFDRSFAFFSVLVFALNYQTPLRIDRNIQIWSIISLLCGAISEAVLRGVKLSPRLHKFLYMGFHTIWHLGVFRTAYLILEYRQVPGFGFWYTPFGNGKTI